MGERQALHGFMRTAKALQTCFRKRLITPSKRRGCGPHWKALKGGAYCGRIGADAFSPLHSRHSIGDSAVSRTPWGMDKCRCNGESKR